MKLKIQKDSEFNFFNAFSVALLTIGQLVFLSGGVSILMSNEISILPISMAIVCFVILFNITKQLREQLIFYKGDETIELKKDAIHYSGSYRFYSRTKKIDFKKIKKHELVSIGSSFLDKKVEQFIPIKYGWIHVQASRNNELKFGHTLSKDKLEAFYEELRKRIEAV